MLKAYIAHWNDNFFKVFFFNLPPIGPSLVSAVVADERLETRLQAPQS